jgi:ATP-binding protein involved in chromosome partitioning
VTEHTRKFRTYHDVADPDAEDIVGQIEAQRSKLANRLADIDRLVVIASGKGGVGKSAITANLAAVLAERGRRVGAFDADLHGPSLAAMLGAQRTPLVVSEHGVEPAVGAAGVKLMSMDLVLSDGAPLEWRQPDVAGFVYQSTLDTGAVRELMADVVWGRLDFLLIDAPPGTDKLARLLELLPVIDTLLFVTTPSEAARRAVGRAVQQARGAGISTIGLIANMTVHECPDCGRSEPMFEADGASRLAAETRLELWAEVPFEPRFAVATDAGRPLVLEAPQSPAAGELDRLAARLENPMSDAQ